MKRLLLVVLCMFSAVAAHAQTVTQQNLQGTWKLVYTSINGVS
jgi:hypothetical protein